MCVRRCPTFPPGLGSIIGAGRLSFRVRDGSGRFPAAMAAATLWTYSLPLSRPGAGMGGRGVREPDSGCGPAGGDTPQVLSCSRRAGRRGLDA